MTFRSPWKRPRGAHPESSDRLQRQPLRGGAGKGIGRADIGAQHLHGLVAARRLDGVLGRTGRNFAAGMSGGIAYVLDLDGSFALNCNIEMVDLDRLQDEVEALQVHELIARHVILTGSAIGDRVLQTWPAMQHKLVAVMPRDFKRVRDEAARSASPAVGDLVGA